MGSVANYPNKFRNLNLLSGVDIDDRYDIIMISNITEWTRDNIQLTNLSQNLYQLLNKDGIVLCSRFNSFPEKFDNEKRIFEKNFELYDYGKSIGYSYIKK